MTNEQLLEKAKIDYPYGTKFRQEEWEKCSTVNGMPFIRKNTTPNHIIVDELEDIGYLWIYDADRNKWAEIVKKPDLIQMARDGEIAIENDGSHEEMKKVINTICITDQLQGYEKQNCRYFYIKNDSYYLLDGTDLPIVSVKSVLKQIEEAENRKQCEDAARELVEESKPKTKVIYLNEEDRPKEESPLSFTEWLGESLQKRRNGESAWMDDILNQAVDQYHEYRNNFKANDKPIEFNITDLNDGNCDLIVVHTKFLFTVFKDGKVHSKIKGKLNSGKV